jgi:hypothetical protein
MLLAAPTLIAQAQKPSETSVISRRDVPAQKVLIIADNQEHLLTGVTLRANSSRTDRIITSVARRSPLANVGGRLLFREALKFGIGEGAELVLHLGDAADISCPDELYSVFEALEGEAKDIWFWTPGNHDGIRVGNYVKDQPSHLFDIKKHPDPDNPKATIYTNPPVKKFTKAPGNWLNACLSPTNSKDAARADILTKEDAINLYVKELESRPDAKPPELLEPHTINFKKTEVPVECKVKRITIESQGYTAIARLCPRTSVTKRIAPNTKWVGPYRSFIVQRLDIGKTRIIMLDTSDYENPYLPRVAFKGDLSEDQIDAAEELLEGGKFDRKNVIIMGHHPLAVIRSYRQWIIDKAGRYISAHTHYSASKINHPLKNPKTVELNVGSTLDYPPQAIIANIGPDAMSFRVAGAKTAWPGFLVPCEKNRTAWMKPLSNSKIYTDYRSDLYVKHLLESLEAAAKIAPSGLTLKIPKGIETGDWLLLDEALQTINAAKGDARIFWACQAYYASEATKDEKSWWERIPKFKSGFQRGEDVNSTEDGDTLTSP